jgi:hypothetical protein|tara:strand:- start:39170 stop:40288 length:1119 start_codon:yes stop_codon:yes gene_type:complete
MQSDQYRRELAQLNKDVGNLRSDIGSEEEKARRARAAAAQKRSSAQRSSSPTSRLFYLRQAESEEKKVAEAEKKIGSLQGKVGTLLGRMATKEQSLRSAEKSESALLERAEVAKQRKDKSVRETSERAAKKQRQTEREHAREIARLSRPTVHRIYISAPEPEKLRVLYLTASPATENVPSLRVDAEVNNVLKALRGAKHRDLIDFQHRPASTVDDLIDGLNDLRPHVVHFSGHASGGLLLDTADLLEAGDQLLSYGTIARVLRATDQRPTLVVLNACNTIEGADAILEAAAVVIATDETVGDASSGVFAANFYGAIGAAQTIGDALDQAREMIALALPGEPDVLTLHAAEGVDPYGIKLVQLVGSGYQPNRD